MNSKWTIATSVFLGLISTAVAYPYVTTEAIGPLEVEAIDVSELNARVQKLDLSDGERVWEKIPWVQSLDQAKALSAQSNRPIFLFSMWGELDSRC